MTFCGCSSSTPKRLQESTYIVRHDIFKNPTNNLIITMCWCTLTCLSRIFSNSFAKVENYGQLLEKLVSSMSCECVLWTSIMWTLSCLRKDQFRRPPSCRRLCRKPLRKACQVRRWLLNNAENRWRTPKRMQTWKCHSPWDRIYILTYKMHGS